MSQVNNLNIFTFIKDIYQALKNIDIKLNESNKLLNEKITALEDRQHTILEKISGMETLLQKINENSTAKIGIDKDLENELLKKMNVMNSSGSDEKIDLKPDELTFANILENGYTFIDINDSLSRTPTYLNEVYIEPSGDGLNINSNINNSMNINDNVNKNDNKNKNDKNENLESLLF